MATKQGTTLTLGHAAPDTELGAVVEGVREAVESDGAPAAHDLGRALLLALDEERVRVGADAGAARGPVGRALGDVCWQLW